MGASSGSPLIGPGLAGTTTPTPCHSLFVDSTWSPLSSSPFFPCRAEPTPAPPSSCSSSCGFLRSSPKVRIAPAALPERAQHLFPSPRPTFLPQSRRFHPTITIAVAPSPPGLLSSIEPAAGLPCREVSLAHPLFHSLPLSSTGAPWLQLHARGELVAGRPCLFPMGRAPPGRIQGLQGCLGVCSGQCQPRPALPAPATPARRCFLCGQRLKKVGGNLVNTCELSSRMLQLAK
jgi:hypothetical protein